MSIKVLVIDDSAVVRQTIKDLLDKNSKFEVIATAQDPIVAAQKLRKEAPDVITLDIEMPRMDGLTFLKKLMNQHPIPVVICSSVSPEGSESAIKALELGAVDIISKPEIGCKSFLNENIERIYQVLESASNSKVRRITPKQRQQQESRVNKSLPPIRSKALPKTTDKIITIGASTGGTEAIKEVLTAMPLDCYGILVVQHMPERFTRSFAQRLDSLCRIKVKEATHGDSVLRGQALISPGDHHMLLKRSGARYYVALEKSPPVSRHRPSVDVLFESAAIYGGQNINAAILTGMGSDGARGMLELKKAGAATCAQDEATSVVYGMPREAVANGGASKEMPLDAIASFLLN